MRYMFWIQAIERNNAIDKLGWWSNQSVLAYACNKVDSSKGISWIYPKEDELKFNVNGLTRGKLDPISCREVLSDTSSSIDGRVGNQNGSSFLLTVLLVG